jgi:Zn-dependent peptidase ImmA (M78 family)
MTNAEKERTCALAREEDSEANLFAMCLLMPEKFVRKWIRENWPDGFDLTDDRQLKNFAKAFAVSDGVAAWRLADLGIIGRPVKRHGHGDLE